MERGGYTYILTNKPRGVLYIGVTADMAARMMQHGEGTGSKFARKYGLDRLVLIERHATIDGAIAREKAMKAWKRAWKIERSKKPTPIGATCSKTFSPSPSSQRTLGSLPVSAVLEASGPSFRWGDGSVIIPV